MPGFSNDTVYGSNINFTGDGGIAGREPTVTSDGQLLIGSTTSPKIKIGNLTSTGSTVAITNGSGTINLDISSNARGTAIHGWNGSILETTSVIVTSDGAAITCAVEKEGGGDLTVVFSDGFYDWDTTPAGTVSLTPGTDSSPVENFVYFLQSSKTLSANTSGFPAEEFAPIATVICQSAASLQTDLPYKLHEWTDHVVDPEEQGHISDLNSWIRSQNATWISGVGQTFTIIPNGGAPDTVLLTTGVGIVRQLHTHTFPAFTGTPDYYVINDSVTPYTIVTDLNALLTDSTGASMSGKFFSLVLWGVVSEGAAESKIFINLPSGSYNNASSLQADINNYATFILPASYKGTAFLIGQWDLRHSVAGSGTWTSIEEIDLRGQLPFISPAGTTPTPTEFADNLFRIFDDLDPTKEIAFQAASITTANTRTITMSDYDLDLSIVCKSAPSDSGTATPAAGVLTFSGGNGIATSGATSIVTVAMASSFTGDFTFTGSTPGDTEIVSVSNTDNTAANVSSASLAINVGGSTQTGDPYISFGTGSARSYSIGTDTTSSQDFKINTDAAATVSPSTGTNILLLDSAGNMGLTTLTVGRSPPEIDIAFTINGVAINGQLAVHADGVSDLGGLVEERHSDTAAFGSHWVGLRSRGSEGSEAVVQSGDVLNRFVSCGYDGTDYAQSAEIRVEIDGTPGDNDMPGRILMLTSADGGQTPIEGLRLDSSQNITLANALTVANGGTGVASTTAYTVQCGGTTSTGALQSIAGVGVAGEVLTSNGPGNLPTFQAGDGGFTSTNIQTFTSSGTYTPTSGMVYCTVSVIGSGAGGGGCPLSGATQTAAGGGGGAGGFARSDFSAATIGVSQAVTIGSAGAGGVGNSAGSGGGTCSLGALISATGGAGGGNAGAATLTTVNGGLGGVGTGEVAVRGGPGGSTFGFYDSGSTGSAVYSGVGGDSAFGGGGLAVAGTSTSNNGNVGGAYGGGGSGAGNSHNQGTARDGGAGATGVVFVLEFIA